MLFERSVGFSVLVYCMCTDLLIHSRIKLLSLIMPWQRDVIHVEHNCPITYLTFQIAILPYEKLTSQRLAEPSNIQCASITKLVFCVENVPKDQCGVCQFTMSAMFKLLYLFLLQEGLIARLCMWGLLPGLHLRKNRLGHIVNSALMIHVLGYIL